VKIAHDSLLKAEIFRNSESIALSCSVDFWLQSFSTESAGPGHSVLRWSWLFLPPAISAEMLSKKLTRGPCPVIPD